MLVILDTLALVVVIRLAVWPAVLVVVALIVGYDDLALRLPCACAADQVRAKDVR
jgi:hypothetical protein